MTNGDRIRAMTDEELAEIFSETICKWCECKTRVSCKECCVEWIQKEADDACKEI